MLYRIENLTKAFGGRKVLDVPELVFEKGRVHALLGPNGAGKTTLLDILGFLTVPNSGSVYYHSRPVDYRGNALRRLRLEVVIVPQTPIMFTTTVKKNVEFGLRVRKTPAPVRGGIAEEMLDLVGMRRFASAKAHTLSGGETQRVAIARALACSPKVIFFDEPTANVDVENRIAIENIIRTINAEKGISVILTSHDPLQAARLADRVTFLFEGRPTRAPYENIYSGRTVIEGDGRFCLVHDEVRFPLAAVHNGPVRIAVDPWRLSVEGEGTPGTVDRLPGRVIQVTDEGDRVRMLVDVGLPLCVLLKRDDYRRTAIRTGDSVMVSCPPEAVDVI